MIGQTKNERNFQCHQDGLQDSLCVYEALLREKFSTMKLTKKKFTGQTTFYVNTS